jgi:Cu+-exporting ATPase
MQYRDPVCGMIVDATTAGGEATYRSQHHYFCSSVCRDRFESSPAEYLATNRERENQLRAGRNRDSEMERHEPPHTSTGPIVAPKFGSAGSGGAEYESIPEQHDD